MDRKTKSTKTNATQEQRPDEWPERAIEAAKQYNIPMPADEVIGSPEEVEQRLRWSEQEGGE